MPRPRSDRSKYFTPPACSGTGCTARRRSRGSACASPRSTGARVTSLCSLGLTPECAIDDIEHTDIIILPASGWDVLEQIARNTALLPWLRKWHARGAYIAGVCTGVAFLAECGLLDGRRATTHWGVADLLRERYPKVLWQPEQFVTEDDHLLCSGGIYASIDLSLYLVEKFCGHEIALQMCEVAARQHAAQPQSGYSVLPLSRPHSDDKIRQTEEYLQKHFDRDVSIEFLPSASAWARATSSAASRLRPAACREPICRCCGYRRPRNCSSRARPRSRRCAQVGYARRGVLPRAVQASHRHDSGGIPAALRAA